MPSKGREHFDTYTAQNRVKHAILTKYLRAYLQALSHAADAFHYIDGFAGPGEYESEHAGSPLYALSLLAAQKKPATASFVENDPTLFAQLEQIVGTAADSRRLLEAPWLRRAAFSDCIDEVDALRQGPQQVKLFTTAWPQRPTDMLVSKEYKSILLGLEREGAIEVFDGRTRLPAPATIRRKRLGQPTLGDDHFVRLR